MSPSSLLSGRRKPISGSRYCIRLRLSGRAEGKFSLAHSPAWLGLAGQGRAGQALLLVRALLE